MRCKICGKDFSDTVFPFHFKHCKNINKENKETDLKGLTVKELKELCKEKGKTGYSRLKEQELIELLEEGE